MGEGWVGYRSIGHHRAAWGRMARVQKHREEGGVVLGEWGSIGKKGLC